MIAHMRFISGSPPANGTRRPNIDYDEILAALRARPGTWAQLDVGKIQTMRVYAGRHRGIAGREYEFRAVPDPDGDGILYGRYIGNPDKKED